MSFVAAPTMTAALVTIQLMLVSPPGAVNVLVEPGQTVAVPVIVKIGVAVIVAVSMHEGLLTQPALLVVINVNV